MSTTPAGPNTNQPVRLRPPPSAFSGYSNEATVAAAVGLVLSSSNSQVGENGLNTAY